eukprot:COSAG02_NODE_4028_length_5886_cov_2.738552_8_plen_104_part_00
MEIPRFIVYNLRQVGHMRKRNREVEAREKEEEEGLRVRCEFVGGANGSAALTAAKPDELGADNLHAPVESLTPGIRRLMPGVTLLYRCILYWTYAETYPFLRF